MANNPQQPQDDDAVIGGHSPSIEGIKARLNNSDPQVRIAALEQAINYGEQGLDLVIQSLKDESAEVQDKAYVLLSEKEETRIQQTLQEFNPEGLKLKVIEVVRVNRYGEIVQRQKHIARYLIEDLGDGITLEMAKIPGGTFMMGSPEWEGKDHEKPQHEVTIQPFFMGKYQITQAQWKAVASFQKVKIDLKRDPSKFKGENRPVELVSWFQSVEFCDRLSQHTGKSYHLPSEAEWEYGCRAGTTTPFHFGETITTDLANYNGDYTYGDGVKGIYRKKTTEVGSFGVANNFGLYDMHGNVYEWCKDTWHSNYKGAPIDVSAWVNDSDNKYWVLRGGSWFGNPVSCRSANRGRLTPDYRLDPSGFRVVFNDVGRTLP